MVKPVGSHQDNQLVKSKLSVEKKGMVSCNKRASVRLAMCLYLAVVTRGGSKALASGGNKQVSSSL